MAAAHFFVWCLNAAHAEDFTWHPQIGQRCVDLNDDSKGRCWEPRSDYLCYMDDGPEHCRYHTNMDGLPERPMQRMTCAECLEQAPPDKIGRFCDWYGYYTEDEEAKFEAQETTSQNNSLLEVTITYGGE
jgi:hypothetical protein